MFLNKLVTYFFLSLLLILDLFSVDKKEPLIITKRSLGDIQLGTKKDWKKIWNVGCRIISFGIFGC